MKKILIFLVIFVFALSALFFGISCKTQTNETTAAKETTTIAEATTTTEAATTETTEAEFDSSQYTIYIETPLKAHPVLRQMVMGSLLAARDLGYKYKWLATEGADIVADVAMLEQCVAEIKASGGKGAIITSPYGGSAFDEVVKAAVKDGIPVIAVHHPVTAAFTTGIGPNPKEEVQLAGKAIAEAVNGKGQIAITQGALWSELESLLTLNYQLYFKANYKDIELLPAEEEGYDPAIAIEKATAIMQKYPKLVAGISTTGGGPSTWAGAQDATGRKLVAVGMDTTEVNLDLLTSDKVFGLIYQGITEEFYDAVKLADKALRGMEVGPIYYSKVDFVTKDKADYYREEAKKVDATLKEFGY